MRKKTIGRVVLSVLLFSGLFLQTADADDLIRIDGSSTVYPITEAVAEEFQAIEKKARITIGVSGTGGGFKKFCHGETDIANASRPIKPEEIKACSESRIQFIEIPIAYDGLAVMVHPKNKWVSAITIGELKKMWEPAAQGKATLWSQIRPQWPGQKIRLFGPGADSGTFDYFTEAVIGKSKASRGDFTASEDDNVLVQGIATDLNALGYFGLAYYEANKNKLKLVAVDGGNGKVLASKETVANGTYPLSRPLFIYVNTQSLKRPDIAKFVQFYLDKGPALSSEVGYISLPQKLQAIVLSRFKKRTVGSLYEGFAAAGKPLAALLQVP
jgi:phosphate transport system substrate-binding protein